MWQRGTKETGCQTGMLRCLWIWRWSSSIGTSAEGIQDLKRESKMPQPGASSLEAAGNDSREEGFQIHLINIPWFNSTEWCCLGNHTVVQSMMLELWVMEFWKGWQIIWRLIQWASRVVRGLRADGLIWFHQQVGKKSSGLRVRTLDFCRGSFITWTVPWASQGFLIYTLRGFDCNFLRVLPAWSFQNLNSFWNF